MVRWVWVQRSISIVPSSKIESEHKVQAEPIELKILWRIREVHLFSKCVRVREANRWTCQGSSWSQFAHSWMASYKFLFQLLPFFKPWTRDSQSSNYCCSENKTESLRFAWSGDVMIFLKITVLPRMKKRQTILDIRSFKSFIIVCRRFLQEVFDFVVNCDICDSNTFTELLSASKSSKYYFIFSKQPFSHSSNHAGSNSFVIIAPFDRWSSNLLYQFIQRRRFSLITLSSHFEKVCRMRYCSGKSSGRRTCCHSRSNALNIWFFVDPTFELLPERFVKAQSKGWVD